MRELLPPSFYQRPPLLVAPDLLGKVLVHSDGNKILSGRIVETEAYLANNDPASHSYRGKTKRNIMMFAEAGTVYVYHIHRYVCLNVVTETEGTPSAVLIRALEPLNLLKEMQKNRNKDRLIDLTSGPGKLTQALGITINHNGEQVTQADSNIRIYDDGVAPGEIFQTTRIGISKAQDLPYRFYLLNNPYVSKR